MRARHYDATTGLFLTIDPLIDETSQPYQYANNNPLAFVDPTGLVACGPLDSGDCNGRNLIPLLNRMSRTYDDAGYLTVVNGMSKQQRDEIGYDQMSLINTEAVNRQTHMQVCAEQGGCLAPCPEQGYNKCQLGRGASILGSYVAGEVMAIGLAAAVSRACVVDATHTNTNMIYSARVLNRAADEPGPYHNFPGSFDAVIFSDGARTVNPNFFKKPKPNLGSDSVLYRLPGEVNGRAGVYEIFTRPSVSGRTELVMHRFFKPDPK